MITFFKRLWQGETDGLTAAAFLVGAASVASRLIGVVRDRLLASSFGAGASLDAYYAAFRLPDFLYNLLILGALTAGFIPVFTEYLESKGREEAARLAAEVFSLVGLVMAVTGIAMTVLAPWIVPHLTPGFSGKTLELTVQLSRVMFLSPFLLGLSAVMGGVLQATRRFFAFALAPVLYNIGIIFGIVLLAPRFGIVGVAWGVVLGAFLHFAVQWSVARQAGMGTWTWPSFHHEGVRRILRLMIPRTIGLAVTQINLVVLLALASSLRSGDVAVFNLANNLQSFPVGIFGISFAVAAFPALSRAAGKKDALAFREALGSAARKIVFLVLPTMVLFLLLRAQIVRLVLGDGRFDWDDTIRTAGVFGWFTFSLAAQSLVALLARAFYALQNTRIPLIVGLISEAINIGLALALRHSLGIQGLAIAFSAASIVNLMVLWILLRRQQGSLGSGAFISSAVKTGLACVAFAAAAYPMRQWLGTIYPLRTFWQVALQAGVSSIVGLIMFAIAARLLGSPEWKEFSEAILRRTWRKAKMTEGADEVRGV